MNDKSIRDILIAWLQATNHEVRIYQEKSIGASICDVMAVTDKLSGYEIKSDQDNYARLQDQVKAYDRFFDENYLVVSQRHSQSAESKVPHHWGILCIQNDNVTILRRAQKNKQVYRRSQLTVLWKLELKNLLIKNNMPLYAQKSRGYISERIAAAVEDDLLGKQIAQELMRRDYSVCNANDFTIYSKGGDGFPAEEIIDMLSEKNLEQFTLDKWIALYRQATAVQEQKETVYRLPVKERVTHAIPYTDIEVSLGVPWISREIIGDFIGHILERSSSCAGYVEYEPVTGNWNIREKTWLGSENTNAEVKYGLKRYNALYIMEATLNLREIKLFDGGSEYNERDTLAALEKQRLINEEFKRWIWLDEDRRWLVEEAYNKIFTRYTIQKYDGSHLQFPDMSPTFSLFDYQKDAVQKIITSPNTLLAFDVGAGKTFIMIAAAMKLRAEGISRKNLFVVPNHIVGQWEKIFTDLYPKAKVLAVEPNTFKPMMRQKVLKQIRDGDYDGIIMAYSCFEMIPLSESVVLNNMDQQLRRLNDALEELRKRPYYTSAQGAVEREKKYILKLTQEFLKSMTAPQTEDITFDKLEINTLFVDEAHNYKNIPIRTKLKNLNGINIKGSSKCLDLLYKVRYVQAANGGRGVVFATGTPLCNSISDAYAMQLYLQHEELEKAHLDVFDNWVKTFALPEQLCEIDVDTSKFRFVRKFSKFFNLPELSRMFSQIAIFYAVNHPDNVPELEGYAEIICGAPVSLYRKRELLLRLKAETPEEDLWAILGTLHCIEDALKALEQADTSDAYLSVELIGYDEEERRTDTIDGPYPVRSLAEAREAVRAYRADCEETDREVGAYCDEHDYNWTADDWETRFWTMELYDLNQTPGDSGFRRPAYIYVLSLEGEPMFFSQQQLIPGLRTQCSRALGMGGLILPTPYKPGDILRIDCRPFVPMPFYCLLIQVRSGSCGLWCLFPNLNGSIGQGALLNGHYCAQEYDFGWWASCSPLYRAEVFTGELPENCSFMKGLSEKIHADPGYGDRIDEVLHDLKL